MICFFTRHVLVETWKVTPHISEMKCQRCGKEFGIHHDLRSVIPLDKELKDLHDMINPNKHRDNERLRHLAKRSGQWNGRPK